MFTCLECEQEHPAHGQEAKMCPPPLRGRVREGGETLASYSVEGSSELTDLLSGRYRLLRQIGSGGMAAVYEGEDTVLGRPIAVKVLHPQYNADEAFVTRFEREARAIAGLKHPGIVE